MKYKFLINTIQIIFSGYLIFVFLESLKVSGPEPNYLSLSAIPVIIAYLFSYLLVIFVSGKHNQLLNIFSLIGISTLGSSIFIFYTFVDAINTTWMNHLDEVIPILMPIMIYMLFIISIIFIVISSLITGCIKIISQGMKLK